MVELTAAHVSVNVKSAALLTDVSLTFEGGGMTAILGPNGAGKSTLLRTLSGVAPPTHGTVTHDGRLLSAMPPKDRARAIAYLPQLRPLAWPLVARDAVALGRYAHGGLPGRLGPSDRAAVDDAMNAFNVAGFANRPCTTLSGGELTRVHCARAVASGAQFVLMDEPTAALDPRQKFEILDRLKQLASAGRHIILVLHEIDLAAHYADRIVLIGDGRVVADGLTTDIVRDAKFDDLFGIQTTSADGRIVIHPLKD